MKSLFEIVILVSIISLFVLSFQVVMAVFTHADILASKTVTGSGSGLVLRWAKSFDESLVNNNNTKSTIGVNAVGNIFVSEGGNSDRYAYVRYNPADGSPVYQNNWLTYNNYSTPNAIDGDSDNNIYLTYSYNGGGPIADYVGVISKHLYHGSLDWSRVYSAAGESNVVYDLEIDSNDNVVALVWESNVGVMRLVKINQFGVTVYDETYSSSDEGYLFASRLAIDGSNNVYVMGRYSGAPGTIQIKKYFPTLTYSGVNAIETSSSISTGQRRDITVDSIGNMYIAGTPPGWDNFGVVKFNTDGSLAWSQITDVAGAGPDRASAIAIDESRGYVYAVGVGQFGSNSENFGTLIARYNESTGQYLGHLRVSPHAPSLNGVGAVIDSDGNLFVTERFGGVEVFKFSPGCSGPLFTGPWADESLIAGGTIKAIHLEQLRDEINALRVDAGLPSYAWTNSSLTGVSIRAIHLTEMRTALSEVYTTCGQGAPTWNPDQTITQGVTAIKAAHITDLRNKVEAAP